MNDSAKVKTGILIDVENKAVREVHAKEWTNAAICQFIVPVGQDAKVCPLNKTGDSLAVGNFINFEVGGAQIESEGFRLYGVAHFGNGLILGGAEGQGEAPTLSARDVFSRVTFIHRASEGPTVVID